MRVWAKMKTALAQDPLNPDSYECLAWIQMGRAHMSEAEGAMRRALDMRPTYAWGHLMVGLALLERKNSDADATLARLIKE
jgi:cytochrome c-type biogenesis protein CcmH/NrfG